MNTTRTSALDRGLLFLGGLLDAVLLAIGNSISGVFRGMAADAVYWHGWLGTLHALLVFTSTIIATILLPPFALGVCFLWLSLVMYAVKRYLTLTKPALSGWHHTPTEIFYLVIQFYISFGSAIYPMSWSMGEHTVQVAYKRYLLFSLALASLAVLLVWFILLCVCLVRVPEAMKSRKNVTTDEVLRQDWERMWLVVDPGAAASGQEGPGGEEGGGRGEGAGLLWSGDGDAERGDEEAQGGWASKTSKMEPPSYAA